MIKILIVEDEESIANLIYMNLVKNGYQCDVAYDGMSGADKIEEGGYDLCIFDIMLPEIDGYELLEYAKNESIPVIFTTAMGKTEEKVKGLRAGAEDYITKPFEVVELLARVETVLRRFHKMENRIRIHDVEIDWISRTVKQEGKIIPLTLKEFEILLLFVNNKDVALYRETIYERVWKASYTGDSRTVDLHVQRLRKKLGWEEYIETVYKIGYKLIGEE